MNLCNRFSTLWKRATLLFQRWKLGLGTVSGVLGRGPTGPQASQLAFQSTLPLTPRLEAAGASEKGGASKYPTQTPSLKGEGLVPGSGFYQL